MKHRGSSDDIAVQVLAAQRASLDASRAIDRVRELISGMDAQVALISAAAGGSDPGSSALGQPGLADLAEDLRVGIEDFTRLR